MLIYVIFSLFSHSFHILVTSSNSLLLSPLSILFRYIYTDEINLTSFELVCDVCYAAKKYMLPALVEECTKFLWRDLYPRNACRAYEFAKLFDEPVLMEKSLQVEKERREEGEVGGEEKFYSACTGTWYEGCPSLNMSGPRRYSIK